MVNEEIAKYMEWHYREHMKQDKRIKVMNVKDCGFYYEFLMVEENVISMRETMLKLELEQWKKRYNK